MTSAVRPRLACPHLLRLGSIGPSLLGSRCAGCGEVYFAAGSGCTRCSGTLLEPVDLGGAGRLWSWTVQGFLPKSPYDSGETEQDFRPYGVGYVEMPSAIKVESRLTVADPDLLAIGMPMVLLLVPYRITRDGEQVFTFAFEPAQEVAQRV